MSSLAMRPVVNVTRMDLDEEDSVGHQISVHRSIREIEEADWDHCANPATEINNPFLSHAFLNALEESGSVSPRKGWATCHLVLKNGAGATIAVMPMYLKSHSQGEYVFDHAWANAYERAGGSYYPKLQTAIPFTPATGRRFLVAAGTSMSIAQKFFAGGAAQLADQNNASSWHVTFATEAEWKTGGEIGLLQRTDTQYHWFNGGYETFDDFLATLASRKRKTVRKEREQALASGIVMELLTGNAITEAHWDAFFAFYMDTGNRKWGTPYLTRKFFSLIGERMADRVLLVMCKREGRYIAGALNFIGGDTLYGRNWGCVEHHNFLHFEACYYQAIDFAIAHKLKCVEAGAQGEHKLARGYVPQTTFSLHYLADPGFSKAVARYLEQERRAVSEGQAMLTEMTPYKKVD